MSDKVGMSAVADRSVGPPAPAGVEVGGPPTQEEAAAFNDAFPGAEGPDLSAQASAYALRLQGVREADIADLTGLPAREVRETLEDRARRAQESHVEEVAIALELDRLDAMLSGLWPAASTGDCAAVDRVLKIGERRDKLLGLHLEAARQKFTAGAGADGLEDLTQEELVVLARLAARRAELPAGRPDIGSGRTRGGKPRRSALKGAQPAGPAARPAGP